MVPIADSRRTTIAPNQLTFKRGKSDMKNSRDQTATACGSLKKLAE
jgi:hypothetical protein